MSRKHEADREPQEVVDLFFSPWVKAFIRINHAHELETVEILLAIGQQLMQNDPRRQQHQLLDIAVVAMLRAALLAGKATDVNLRHGVYEPALGHLRTLLELDFSLEYMLADNATKDQRANRYWAWSYKKRIGSLKQQLTIPEMQAKLDAERVTWIKERVQVYEQNLAVLPDAAAQNQEERNWHPHQNLRGLAVHLGRLDDYLQLYAPFSGMAVHAADPETHVLIEDNGRVRIKALATTEPRAVSISINLLASFLVRFLERFRDEWALEDTPIGRLLTLAAMRFVGQGDGEIPAELQPEEWPTAIQVTQGPLAEILEEAVQLLLVVVQQAPQGLTEAEIRDVAGLEVMQLGERGNTLLRQLLEYVVETGKLRLDASVEPHRFLAAGS